MRYVLILLCTCSLCFGERYYDYDEQEYVDIILTVEDTINNLQFIYHYGDNSYHYEQILPQAGQLDSVITTYDHTTQEHKTYHKQ